MQPTRKNFAFLLIALTICGVSGISAWRFLAFLGFAPSNWASGVIAWGGVTLGFSLFWLVVLYGMRRFRNTQSNQYWLAALTAAMLFGLISALRVTPGGFSKLTLELYAENVWSPTMFSMGWTGDGLAWSVPLSLPNDEAAQATLEIIAAGPSDQAAGRQVWLISAAWPDGRVIPPEEFQIEDGWENQEVSWGTYQRQPVWISRQNQPATLRWKGEASGPLTLVFSKHDQAGQVIVRWNGAEQKLDLYAPEVVFHSLTLPINEPAIWRANLPISALAEAIRIFIKPDPANQLSFTLQKISVLGLPGRMIEISGDKFLDDLGIYAAKATLSPTGLHLRPDSLRYLPQITLLSLQNANLGWSLMIPWLENVLVVMYIAIAGGVTLGNLARLLKPDTLVNVNIALISIIIALLLGEAGLRFYLPTTDQYYIRPPFLHRVFYPRPGTMPGVTGESHFMVNSQGLRADEFPAEENAYTILAIGGSTTECTFLDQTEAWPQRLQDELNNYSKSTKVWVGNAGQSGRTTREHTLHIKYLLPQYPSLDTVILLIGVNDLGLRFSQGEAYTPDYLPSLDARQALMRRAFDIWPTQNPNSPYYTQTAAWRLLSRSRLRPAPAEETRGIIEEDDAGESYIQRRAERKTRPIRENLPDLSLSLAEYERNINTIIDSAQEHQVRLILMTQPTFWRNDLTQAEKNLLWFGWGPEREFFYSLEAMIQGMAAYNEKLLEVCRQRQVECIDLATLLPKDTTVFYDDVHFNESGAERVAKVVADYLLRHEPLLVLNN